MESKRWSHAVELSVEPGLGSSGPSENWSELGFTVSRERERERASFKTCTLFTGVLPGPRLSSLPPLLPTQKLGRAGRGVDSVPGNNRPITPSGPSREKELREKELREGNSSPSGRGHRPLVASPVGVSGPSLCSRPRPHSPHL
jgi:hypothetical protein